MRDDGDVRPSLSEVKLRYKKVMMNDELTVAVFRGLSKKFPEPSHVPERKYGAEVLLTWILSNLCSSYTAFFQIVSFLGEYGIRIGRR